MIISSTLFKNSGLKYFLSSSLTWCAAAFSRSSSPESAEKPTDSLRLARKRAPIFDVIIITVFRKSVFLPSESVRKPSSRTLNSRLKTSASAFSISSKSTIEYGERLTLSVSCPPSSKPTYPGGAPTSLETECFSENSDISNLIILSSEPKRHSASAFVSSVFPTPVGPKNINEPIGLFGAFIPALVRLTALATALTAPDCPTILL